MFDFKRALHTGDKVAIGVIVLSFIAGLLFYSSLPDQIASHWNLDGLPNGFMPTQLFVIGFPLLMLLSYLAMSKISTAKELRYEMELLHREYAGFKASIATFLAYIYIIILYSNSEFAPLHVSTSQLLLPGVSVLLYYLATVLPRLKRNHLVGIRTPWTIHSDEAWHKTHVLGGKLFKALSVLVMFATLTASTISTGLVVIPILAVGVILVVYSYTIATNAHGKLSVKGKLSGKESNKK